MNNSLQGIATVSLWAADHAAATAWYSRLFGIQPYFERPGYAEFRVGGDETEVGIIDKQYAAHMAKTDGPSGVIAYWHTNKLQETYETIISMGAASLHAPEDRGHGFVTATVVDPFGNILGIMHNPHYTEMQAARRISKWLRWFH